jgi:uncharacterized protein YcfJ
MVGYVADTIWGSSSGYHDKQNTQTRINGTGEHSMKLGIFVLLTMVSMGAMASDARVVATEPVYQNSTQYRQVCTPVVEQRRSIGGTLIGGAIGAAIGNQVGGGSGRDIATATGAVVGAAVGQNAAGDNQVVTNQCVNEPYTVQTVSQYKVTVEIGGQLYTVYRSFGPQVGSLIPVSVSVN